MQCHAGRADRKGEQEHRSELDEHHRVLRRAADRLDGADVICPVRQVFQQEHKRRDGRNENDREHQQHRWRVLLGMLIGGVRVAADRNAGELLPHVPQQLEVFVIGRPFLHRHGYGGDRKPVFRIGSGGDEDVTAEICCADDSEIDAVDMDGVLAKPQCAARRMVFRGFRDNGHICAFCQLFLGEIGPSACAANPVVFAFYLTTDGVYTISFAGIAGDRG